MTFHLVVFKKPFTLSISCLKINIYLPDFTFGFLSNFFSKKLPLFISIR